MSYYVFQRGWTFKDVDAERIVKIFKERGHSISHNDAILVWEVISDNYAAGWLIMPSDDQEVFDEVCKYLKKVDSEIENAV